MTRRLFLPLFFAALLAFTQQAAVIHPYSHAEDWQETSQHGKQAPHPPSCAKCVAYAGMTGFIGVTALTTHILSAQLQVLAANLPDYLAATLLPYHSRAPPFLA